MKKRLLAMLLVLMLVVGLLPVGVLAADDVSILRLMNRDEWRSSALARAGVGEGDDVDIQGLFVYDQYSNVLNNGEGTGMSGSDGGWFRTYISATGIRTDDIDKIILLFTYTNYFEETTTVAAVFDKEDFYVGGSGGAAGTRYAEIRLTERGKTVPDGIQVNFYAAIGNRTDYVLYDTVYVNSGGTIGSEMPATPDTGEYHFVGWQTELDGSGKALFSDTVITEPWTVYGAKVSVEGGTQYHVMKNSTGGMVNALNAKLAELYGGGVDANSFHITAMRVNDSEGKHTNENYIGNEWKDNTYYLIWNNPAENPADPGADHKNTRILVEDIASLTVYGTIGSTEGETFAITISRSELEFQKVSDEIIEIKIRDDKVNEPDPGPGPDEPSDPANGDLGQLSVILDCTNETAEHANKTFHMNTGNSTVKIESVGGTYICTVTPDYSRILNTYNTQVAPGHNYTDVVDNPPTFTMTWNDGWKAEINTITRDVACKTEEPEPVQYAVNYHIVDANGNVISEYDHTDYVNAGGYTDYVLLQPAEQAGCTFSGWFQKIADLEANHAEVTALYADKKWELYGRFTPNEPTAEWLQANVMIQVDCQTLSPSVHGNRDYTLIDGSYGEGTLSAREDGGWQYSFTVRPEKYLDAYAKEYGEHIAINSPRTVTLHFTDGEWVNHDPDNNIYAVFDVICVGPTDIPDADDLAALKVTVKDHSGAIKHGQKSYGLEGGCYELPDSFVHDADKGIYTYTITVDYNAYAAKFDKDMSFADGTHTPTLASNKWQKFVFTWTNGEWVADQDSITVGVKCSVPEAPDVSELVKVTVKDHADGTVPEGADDHGHKVYSLIKDTYTMSEPAVTGDTYTVTVKLTSGEEYAAKYSADMEYKHVLTTTVNPDQNKPGAKTLTYNFATGTWKASDNGFTLGVECVLPHVPTIDDVGGNDFKVKIECIDTETTTDATYGLLDFENTYKFEKENDATYYLVVTADAFLADYNEKNEIRHVLADGQGETESVLLAWDYTNGHWDVHAASVTFDVEADKYDIVYHGNGGATESGAVQSTSNFKYGSEATIKKNPFTYDGYVFEGWARSADGEVVYTGSEKVPFTEKEFPGLLENGKVEFFAVWAEDKLGGGEDGNKPDGVADYRQVFVKYVAADGNGFVTPSFDTFNLEVDENGKVMTNVALSLEGEATPNADATFAYWTIEGLGYDGGAYSYEADLSGKDFIGYVAGETYTFTAYFNGPVVKPEQPNVYEIYVTVHNGTATFCGSEVTSHILAAENEDITITFTPDEGYTLDYATIDGNMLLIPDDGVYTLKQVDSDHTIEVFYESDKIGTEDPNEGDGVPDKYQATVNFVAGENGEVTGDVTKVYTIFGADGKYAEEGVITPSLEGVTVTPDEGYKVDGWTNAADERVNPESEITVEGGDVVVFTVNFQSDPSLKEITSFEKKLVTDRKTYHSFGLRVPTFIRNGSTVVVDEGKGVTLLYAISLTGTPGAEYAITDTGADVADGYALTGVIPETGVVTVYVTKDFTWREAAAAAYKDDALVNTAAVELTDNPNEPGQESTEEVDVVIDWDDPNVPVVPSDPDDDDDEDEDDEVFVPNWLNTTDHYSYIVGYEDGTIRPGNNITRAEVATIFYRLLSEGSSERWYSASNSFSDVAADSWYNVPVSTLSNMGIIDGYEDGTFKPNAPITRAEFTAIATRFFDYTAEYEGAFNDVTYSDWYADCVQAAVDMGLVNGYADGGFHPNAYITRAESCAIVNRVLNRVPHEDHLLDEDEMITWPDNRYGAWYYADMQEATNSHDYDWISVSGEVVEEWTDKLAEPNW